LRYLQIKLREYEALRAEIEEMSRETLRDRSGGPSP